MSNAVFIGTVVELCGERIPEATVCVKRNRDAIVFECSVFQPPSAAHPPFQYAAGYAQSLLELALTKMSQEEMGTYVADRLVRDLETAIASASATPAPPSP